MADLLADLAAERAEVRGLVEPLGTVDWARPTPAEGWTIQDQVWHLAWFDGVAARALADPGAMRELTAGIGADFYGFLAGVEREGRGRAPGDVLAAWGKNAAAFDAAAAAADPRARAPWFGVDMSATSLVTARIMETWAHGVDVADALGRPVVDSARVRHVVFLGWRAIPFAYRINGRTAPDAGIRIAVTSHDGRLFEFGPTEGAAGTVSGPALDLALVVTQRRHWRDTGLEFAGAAEQWAEIAQAFAGPPGAGRPPSSPSR